MPELRQARFFAAACVAFYAITVWFFWKEPWAPPPAAPEAPAEVWRADEDGRAFREGTDALAQLAPLVRWFFRPPTWVGEQLVAVAWAWMRLPASAVRGC